MQKEKQMESLFNQAVSFFIFGGILSLSGIMVWLRNNHNSFKEVLGKVQSLLMRTNEQQKVIDTQINDITFLRSQTIKLKTEIDQVQEYNAKLLSQMQILAKRQKLFRDKLIPQKVIIEASSDLSKQYAKHFSTIKKQLKDL